MIKKIVKIFELGSLPDDPFYGSRFTKEEHLRYQKFLTKRFKNFTNLKKMDAEFETFCKLLDVYSVEYLIVGGYAIAYYGYNRKIGDIDFWIKPSLPNFNKLRKAIESYGFKGTIITKNLQKIGMVIQLGVPPIRIDLLLGLPNMKFNSCFKMRKTTIYNEIKLDFISLEDLKKSKILGGRKKDLSDLEILKG